jgi:hypothetical protein
MKATVQHVEVKEKPDPGDIVVVQLMECKPTEPIKIKRGPRAGQTFVKLDWKFRVVEGQFEDVELYGKTGAELSNHPDNDFRHYCEALLQVESLDVGQGVDTDDLLGLLAYANVIGEPYTKNGQDRLAIKIGSLMPYDGGA